MADRSSPIRIAAAFAAALLLCGGATGLAQAQPTASSAESHPSASHASATPSPPIPSVCRPTSPRITRWSLPGRTLHFTATAGSIRLRDDKNAPQADVAFVAYQLDGADKQTRPVTFVFNGGPGMASGWLQVGGIGRGAWR